MTIKKKIDLNNEKVKELKAKGKTECFLNQLPSRRLASSTNGIIAIVGNRAIFSSYEKDESIQANR